MAAMPSFLSTNPYVAVQGCHIKPDGTLIPQTPPLLLRVDSITLREGEDGWLRLENVTNAARLDRLCADYDAIVLTTETGTFFCRRIRPTVTGDRGVSVKLELLNVYGPCTDPPFT